MSILNSELFPFLESIVEEEDKIAAMIERFPFLSEFSQEEWGENLLNRQVLRIDQFDGLSTRSTPAQYQYQTIGRDRYQWSNGAWTIWGTKAKTLDYQPYIHTMGKPVYYLNHLSTSTPSSSSYSYDSGKFAIKYNGSYWYIYLPYGKSSIGNHRGLQRPSQSVNNSYYLDQTRWDNYGQTTSYQNSDASAFTLAFHRVDPNWSPGTGSSTTPPTLDSVVINGKAQWEHKSDHIYIAFCHSCSKANTSYPRWDYYSSSGTSTKKTYSNAFVKNKYYAVTIDFM